MRFKVIGIVILSLFTLLFLQSIKNSQANINPKSLTGDFNFSETKGSFNNQIVYSQEVKSINNRKDTKVLGELAGPKRIEIDLTNQKLYAFVGETKIYDFLISSGKWGKTPTGTFHIWGKFRYIKMSGGSKALHTYYYLPNVPYVMFFENEEVPAYRGFGIHGTYWHNNFGHPMSHGCINMKTEEAGLIYELMDIGTEIVIYGVAPES
ncbi:hypothetical protein A2130_01300 [Candidatus Woesebacteria bacterium GWC2_33_12]|uniref:L,D-TPase catalytic domain-containing protein n=1 Tax=Candidatus Woesebacteria bacterium GW2011_GWB1_33_22 TaxID=1618566 RepID=A0A0F9ZJC2_9BACT|nr:MAG: hypothetical protein UR29_C0012G0005 [Candidatus Woesebacteria bacterium GW2011_GWC2_33_12]KKP41760.1 MAG: hypothetical protein UR33_C0010G0005 [Candidatus Woesebacteria bacterium GW2011_GWA2_33_20]KKP44214.1 MAG: hypothetical protein UR35_C0010G0006 [Candidatus Woesebacteria bacterium GW2011_GWB1_33_22]KKP45920.1 MAG: hypothetical protein UR37_C0013G0006 [Microgenomates group bacterium GW2011_GWC1_33_28]KKP49805.1 MAG: hypothetical protein UR41_C0012G0006 [Candidatus Woesebacteria bact